LFVLRRRLSLRTEKGIFLYHFVSAVFSGMVGLGFAALDPAFGVPGLVLVLSLHGIYSLSFLELWSLAQGGYSLSIIAGIAQAEAAGSAPDFSGLAAIGEAKQADRVATLERLGLVARTDGRISLTTRGGTIAFVLHALRRWVDLARRAKVSAWRSSSRLSPFFSPSCCTGWPCVRPCGWTRCDAFCWSGFRLAWG
jgi:hypothetical protein